ncbi:hypothetical protein [Achromobacter denitrificans]|uniref:hypothetical protein n=1 Tax=Achromobacter denitrificans TaxID=32002 RepID=UPI001669A38E|nr:hypothetical protein [Achromobacter denitrificans]MDF3849698.1 hypothetical protein [Achromobacter denitrificans]MDF3862492.1 hypothetical protein [Achromobacter denitrificans]GFN28167.1 hypothetical protein ADE_38650 [Achromobacter denitrificans]
MAIAQEVFETGRQVAAVFAGTLSAALRAGIERYVGWPYKVASASVVDADGAVSDTFAVVVYAAKETSPTATLAQVPADSAAVVVDATDSLTIDNFRAAYARVARAKRLKKSPAPKLDKPTTTVTLGVIYSQRSDLPLEAFAEELERLNAATPSREWPDMIVVASMGAIQYAAQFPGESLSGDYLPPAEGALNNYIPPVYVLIVLRPTGTFTFNKMMSFVVAHLGIFSPGAKLSNFTELLDGVPKTAMVMSGYQYDLKGNLSPVPRNQYQDRFVPAPPFQITDRRGQHLATIQLIPWQDGGTILLKGKLPLLGLLPFFGRQDILKAGVVTRPENLQISYVLPITSENFGDMLTWFQQRSNMLVKHPQSQWIVQKLADEGSASPFMARLFMGLLRLRDAVYPDPMARESFDKAFDFVPNSLFTARTVAKEMSELWAGHARKVAAGEVVRQQGAAIHIDENIGKELRRQVEHFLNNAARVVKQGMQGLTTQLGVDIGFMFKQQPAFERGIAALRATDPLLANYLEKSRQTWSERLIKSRNDLEHNNWSLPRVTYDTSGANIVAVEPLVAGQPVTEFVQEMLDRVCCFVEDVTAHCVQQKMAAPITITEIPLVKRRSEAPERFQLTLSVGGQPRWNISYQSSLFEKV